MYTSIHINACHSRMLILRCLPNHPLLVPAAWYPCVPPGRPTVLSQWWSATCPSWRFARACWPATNQYLPLQSPTPSLGSWWSWAVYSYHWWSPWLAPCCTGVKVLMPYIQTSTASLTCNRSTCKGRLASTFYQEAVSRLVTSPRSGRPICPPSVTGKPVKPNLLFNSSSSFRKHPTSISAERGFTHQTPHYGQMA